MDFLLDPGDVHRLEYTAERVLYTSTNSDGETVATSGMVVVPKAPWRGEGERPVVALAPGTQGLGDACAPSRSASMHQYYEMEGIRNLVRQGYAVAVTDYQGLGTEGEHTYMARTPQGRALLDVARVATRTDAFGLQGARVGLTGYSQGGSASAAATEMAGEYAPDVDVRGAAIGAPAADLTQVAPRLDGSMMSGLVWFALVGLQAEHDLDLERVLNERGLAKVAEARNQCVPWAMKQSFQDSEDFTRDGRSISELLATDERLKAAVEANRLGTRAPAVPSVVTHSLADDTLPYAQGRQMARDWCSGGAGVRLYSAATPTHVGGYVPHSLSQATFFSTLFAGRTPVDTCGSF
ncbi:lipase family protein [Kytococcus sp. Marseille-QA3725]